MAQEPQIMWLLVPRLRGDDVGEVGMASANPHPQCHPGQPQAEPGSIMQCGLWCVSRLLRMPMDPGSPLRCGRD